MDQIIPFLINESPVRGRFIRLGPAVDAILARHQYPALVSRLLAEALVVASLLASNLKQGGIFTIQVQSKGPISLLVVDASYGGALRGYAQFDEQQVEALESEDLSSVFGEGYLAITFDPGEGTQRYQGVVPLEGDSIAAAVQHYCTHSQQLDVEMMAVIGSQVSHDEHSGYVAAGLYIEKMPEDAEADEDAWPKAKALMQTVRDEELLDVTLSGEDLLHRLYHEDGVWIYDPLMVKDECRHSREKIEKTLAAMSEGDLQEMAIDGTISVTCQFCNTEEVFTLENIKHTANE